MLRSLGTHSTPAMVNRRVMLWLYPRLRETPADTWPRLLEKARDTEFVTGEWIGIVGGTCFVVWLLGMESAAQPLPSRLFAFLLQFAVALPLLALVVGPFMLRRTRRGLDREIARSTQRAPDTSVQTAQEDL